MNELTPAQLHKELQIRLQELDERNVELEQLKKRVAKIERLNREYKHELANLTYLHNGMSQSISWRVTKPLRVVRNVIRQIVTVTGNAKELIKKKGGLVKVFKRAVTIVISEGPIVFYRMSKNILAGDDDYPRWVMKYDTFDKEMLEQLNVSAKNLGFTPLISIVMPVYNTPVEYLEQAINSVQNQAYKNWELCIADDASTNADVIKLLKRYEEQDERIKVVYCEKNGHISKASNKALELVTGDYVALLDHDDLLREHTLYLVVKELNDHPDCKFIYSDEDKVTEDNVRINPHFKPDWSPDLLLSMNYLCHFSVFKTDIIKEIGGFREGYEGSQDYDLQLRFTERLASNEIRHLPYVLYHWRIMPGSTASGPGEKDYCAEAGLHAVNDYFIRNKIRASASLIPNWGTIVNVKYDLPDVLPLVSIIIPTRNGFHYLKQCLDSIFEKTTYSNYEIIIVDNNSDEQDLIEYLEDLQKKDKVNVSSYPGKFNYSAINNFAVGKAAGEIICLLNNDTEVISSEWLSELVSHALRPEVGVVGAKLLYDDDTIQHGGVLVGVGGVASHAHRLLHKSLHGYFGRAGVTLNYSAVTGACMAVRKELYLKLGGLDEDVFAVAYNDIDFCLRVREQGYWNVWTPMALLYHYESKTRGYEDTPEKKIRFEKEQENFRDKWGRYMENDPAYNPNLSREKDFGLAFPPKSSLRELF